MHRASVTQISAEPHRQVVQSSLFSLYGQQVRQGLGGMIVSAVAGIDHGHRRMSDSHRRGAFLRVAHGKNIHIARHHGDGIGKTFPFGCGAGVRIGKAQHIAPQGQHRRFKAESGSGGRLEKEGGKGLMLHGILIPFGMGVHLLRQIHHPFDFPGGQVQNIQKMLHACSFPIQLSSEGLSRKAISLFTSSLLT